MTYDDERFSQRFDQWTDSLRTYQLPSWDELPQLDLYMDQVIILLTRYLGPMLRDQDSKDDKPITASIINNYVRMKVMPPPVKKKYNRVHLAYLVVICTLKQSLSISCIQRMLPEDQSEGSVKAMYIGFTEAFRSTSESFLTRTLADDEAQGGESLLTTLAVLSNLSKCLTEHLLREEWTEDEDGDL